MKIDLASEQAKGVDIPVLDKLPESTLTEIENVMRYGLFLHKALGIKENERPLPVHVHPSVILSLIQEIRENRGRV